MKLALCALVVVILSCATAPPEATAIIDALSPALEMAHKAGDKKTEKKIIDAIAGIKKMSINSETQKKEMAALAHARLVDAHMAGAGRMAYAGLAVLGLAIVAAVAIKISRML